jgi:hypothetical protein
VRSAILGHELQHACEVANSAATDEDGIRELFQQKGHRAGDYFETRGAVEAERRVLRELMARTVLQAEPVAKFHH